MKFTTQFTTTRYRSASFATLNTDDTLTQQSDAAETNINIIMERYSQTGQLPHVATNPIWGDFRSAGDYRAMVESIQKANEAFHEIPAKIRREFDNDPAEFVTFAANPDNLEKLREWGLAPKPEKKYSTLDDVVEKLDKLKPEIPSGQNQNK